MMSTKKRKSIDVRTEPQPDPEALARIEAVEDHGIVYRMEYASDLDDWDGEERDELDDKVEVEDRSACDLGGMTLAEYAEWLRAVLPGHVHGYSPSMGPDGPTPGERWSPEWLRVLRSRLRRGMALHRPEDYERRVDRHE